MTIYTILIEDRHADPDVELYSVRDEAFERAHDLALEYARSPDDITDDTHRDCELLLSYSPESDRITVFKKELQ